LTVTGETSFLESGSIRFADGNHRLRFSTVGQGYLADSPEPKLKSGAVMWKVDGGEGQFAGASGLHHVELHDGRGGPRDRQSVRRDLRSATTFARPVRSAFFGCSNTTIIEPGAKWGFTNWVRSLSRTTSTFELLNNSIALDLAGILSIRGRLLSRTSPSAETTTASMAIISIWRKGTCTFSNSAGIFAINQDREL
jgi:hypothetical protein